MKKEIFRWIDKEGNKHEYRFSNGICDGFFSNNIENYDYKGKKLTDDWRKNLQDMGFLLIR